MPTKSNPTDWQTLCDYVRATADTLGLRDWDVRVHDDPSEEGFNAQMYTIEGKHLAWIQFATNFSEIAPEEQRKVVVHELLHVHHTALEDVLWHDLRKSDSLSKPQFTQLWQTYRRTQEYVIDALACVIAHGLPLIPWNTKEETHHA